MVPRDRRRRASAASATGAARRAGGIGLALHDPLPVGSIDPDSASTRAIDLARGSAELSRDGQVIKMWETQWRPLVLSYVRQCAELRAMLYVHDVRSKS